PAALPELVAGNFRVTTHVMFECMVGLDGKTTTYLGLNDVVVNSGPPFRMLDLDLVIDGEVASSYRGDGLILSTPIGSTAHGLSAGGPIVAQDLPVFVVTPICPHALTARTVVESADKAYTIVIRTAESAFLVIDGQDVVELRAGAQVQVRRAPV